MVIRSLPHIGRFFTMGVVLTAVLLLCACAPAALVSVTPGFAPPPDQEAAYVVPFGSILVPTDFSAPLFDDFVDLLNAGKTVTPFQQFVILKQDLAAVDPAWLARQTYITGESWGYVENSGCCSTEIRVKTRIQLYEPGKSTPSVEVTLPVETFFDHDRSTIPLEQLRLAEQAAKELSGRILSSFSH